MRKQAHELRPGDVIDAGGRWLFNDTSSSVDKLYGVAAKGCIETVIAIRRIPEHGSQLEAHGTQLSCGKWLVDPIGVPPGIGYDPTFDVICPQDDPGDTNNHE